MSLDTEEKRIAQRAIHYLRQHGLTITDGWNINGTPPVEVRSYLGGVIQSCFPTDEDELADRVIEMIQSEMD